MCLSLIKRELLSLHLKQTRSAQINQAEHASSIHLRPSNPEAARKPPHLHSLHGGQPPSIRSSSPNHDIDTPQATIKIRTFTARKPQKGGGRSRILAGLFVCLSWRRRRGGGGMGRGKIEIRRIENSTNRQVTFSKRRAGIIKKAREIGVLCDAEVGVVIFSSAGKLYDYCSPRTTLPRILEKYQTNSGKILWDEKHKSLSAEIDRVKKENDNMQIELRHLKGEDLNSLQPKELIAIEEALHNGQTNLRDKQMDHWRMHKRNEKMLEDEHKLLAFRMHQQDVELSGGMGELELGYHYGRDFSPQMPFSFRVQPSHPNLQEDK